MPDQTYWASPTTLRGFVSTSSTSRPIAVWREGGNNLFAFGFATFVGLAGLVALFVANHYSRQFNGPGFVLLVFIALLVLVPFGTVASGQLTRGGTRLYSDRLEVHHTLWPWSSNVYQLDDLAGAGLFLHRTMMSQPNVVAQQPFFRWEGALWRSATDATNESSIEMVHDMGHHVAKEYAEGKDPIGASRAGRIMTATYEQALRCQGPIGPASARVHLSGAGEAQIAGDAVLTARWTPFDGYHELDSGAGATPDVAPTPG